MARAEDPSARQELLLLAYQGLLDLSSKMLHMARAGDWASLVEQESRYLVQVERIQRMDAQQHLDDERASRKAALLEQILEQDMEIRRHLVARRDELGELIGSSRRQQALHRAYGPQRGAISLDDYRSGKQ